VKRAAIVQEKAEDYTKRLVLRSQNQISLLQRINESTNAFVRRETFKNKDSIKNIPRTNHLRINGFLDV
jgi:hypothetical protein